MLILTLGFALTLVVTALPLTIDTPAVKIEITGDNDSWDGKQWFVGPDGKTIFVLYSGELYEVEAKAIDFELKLKFAAKFDSIQKIDWNIKKVGNQTFQSTKKVFEKDDVVVSAKKPETLSYRLSAGAENNIEQRLVFVPLEVIQPLLDDEGAKKLNGAGDFQWEVAEEIRFNRWRVEAWTEYSEPIVPWVEYDRFHFRIHQIAKPLIEDLSAKIDVGLIQDVYGAEVTDPRTAFEFVGYPESYLDQMAPNHILSCPFYLVADSPDDKTFNGRAGSDEEMNDTTHLGGFSSTVRLQLSQLNGGRSGIFKFGATKPIGEVHVNFSLLLDAHQTEVPAGDAELIMQQFYQMRDIYRQLGILIIKDGPIAGTYRTDRMYEIEADNWIDGNKAGGNYEGSDFIAEVLGKFERPFNSGSVHCVFTNGEVGSKLTNLNPLVSTLGWYLPFQGKQVIFGAVSEPRPVIAHELGHALGLEHTNEEMIMELYWLMSPVVSPFNNDHKGQKRFKILSENSIKNSVNYKATQ